MNEITQKLKDQLTDSSRALADLTANIIYDNPKMLDNLTELALSEESPYAQRAARVMSICSIQYPELFSPYRQQIIKKMASLRNEAVIRSLLQIYAEIPLVYKQKEKSVLLNICFDLLVAQNTPVAIKVYSMEILYKLSCEIPDIGLELQNIIENQMPFSSAGFKSRGGKILKKLAKTL